MTNKEQKESFPWNFIIIGVLICCLLTCANIIVHGFDNPILVFFVIVIVSGLVGYIPMKIAHKKQTKHRHKIYILSVVAMSTASILVSIVAILWACFDNKSIQNNKKQHAITWNDYL